MMIGIRIICKITRILKKIIICIVVLDLVTYSFEFSQSITAYSHTIIAHNFQILIKKKIKR